MGVGAAALLVLLASSSWYWYGHRQPLTSAGAGADKTAAGGAIGSVAVIPFVNTGGNPQDEYFSDGMTDELAHALSRLPNLRIAGRSSSYAFKGKSLPAQDIGNALHVSAVVEGSIRRAGDRLRVIAQLTSASDGRVLWSDSYESKAKDVFQVQDEFTKAIVGALTPALTGTTAATLARADRGTQDQAAYELYLRGRYFFLRRGETGLRRAIGYFAQALARDPKYARAQAGISMAYSILPAYAPINADSANELALAAANLAVAADSMLGDAHLALANALTGINPQQAEPEFQKAIAIQPDDATSHQWHGDNLELLGRLENALAEERRAQQLDPLAAIMTHEVAYALYLMGRFDESAITDHRALEVDSTLAIAEDQMAIDYLFLGRSDSAIKILQRSYARDLRSAGAQKELLLAYAAAGRWAEADHLRQEIEKPGNTLAVPFDRMVARLAFGDVAGAFTIFEQITAKGPTQSVFGCDPEYAPLKTDPRFAPILNRKGAATCATAAAWPIKAPPAQYAVKK